MAGVFAGKWTYRSFRSNPDLGTPFEQLEFGRANLEFDVTDGTVKGKIGGTGWSLDVSGSATEGTPAAVRFTGSGDIGGENWVYDYLGFFVPPWPNGVHQRPAIIGTIIRTVPHSEGQAPAGVVAQWMAVKQDD